MFETKIKNSLLTFFFASKSVIVNVNSVWILTGSGSSSTGAASTGAAAAGAAPPAGAAN